jgi:hypothetical protein
LEHQTRRRASTITASLVDHLTADCALQLQFIRDTVSLEPESLTPEKLGDVVKSREDRGLVLWLGKVPILCEILIVTIV